MKEKITPRSLDKSSDKKLVSNTSMIDALNLYISDDLSGPEGNRGSLKNVKGNTNVDYAYRDDEPINPGVFFKAIGSVTDPITNVCYVFMWSEDPRDHGIWAYDTDGILPHVEFGYELEASGLSFPTLKPNLRKIFTSSDFNFPEHGFVKGNVVHINKSELQRKTLRQNIDEDGAPTDDYVEEFKYPHILKELEDNHHPAKNLLNKDCILYFTDNENEPRKINVYRALLNKDELQLVDPFTRSDFICACPKAPLERISFSFSPDSSKLVNNFATSPGFQFAYQNIYKDGVESSISVYSDVAFPPSVLNRGAAQSSNLLDHNLCTLKIPHQGQEIEKIRILARYGNSANFFEIDEVNNMYSSVATGEETEGFVNNWNLSTREYKFYNDRVGSGVSPQEVDKTFDNVPRKAQAQTVINNRLIYGNYLEDYDNVKTLCESEVIYNTRPIDYIDLTLKAHPSIEPTAFGGNKSVGLQIDTTGIPNIISAGTVIDIVLTYTPDRNFHLYQARKTTAGTGQSYHQSRASGNQSSNANGYRHWPLTIENNLYHQNGEAYNSVGVEGANFTHTDSPADLQEQGIPEAGLDFNIDFWNQAIGSGQDYLEETAEMFFGQNYGVGCLGNEANVEGSTNQNDLPLWRSTNFQGVNAQAFVDGNNGHKARYGTSAGNPLILAQQTLNFEVKFTVINDITSNGKQVVSDTVAEALAGADGNPTMGGLFTHATVDPNSTGALVYINLDDVKNVVKITKDEYDLGLGYLDENGDPPFTFEDNGISDPNFYFPSFPQNHELSLLVCGVGALDHNDDVIDNMAYSWGKTAQQSMPFGYFIINRAEVHFYLERVGGNHDGGKHLRLGISKIDVGPEDVMTCIRRLDPRSPWWAVHPSTVMSGYFGLSLSSSNSPALQGSPFNAVYNTVAEEGSDEYIRWNKSVAKRFTIADPLLYEGEPEAVNPYTWFIARFETDHTINGFEVTSGVADNNKWCNLGFCGCIDLLNGGQTYTGIYKPHNLDGTDFIPRLGLSVFKFSLMDGEGGPGGASAGFNSAYDNHGNNTYGSIAGRVDFGYDGSSVDLTRRHLGNGNWMYQAFVGGSYLDNDEVEQIGFTPAGTGNESVATDLGLEQVDVDLDGGLINLWRETYVVSGPFYTGSIAMNPVVGELEPDAANSRPFSPVKDYTTTLPLIWVNSQGRRLKNNSIIPSNWLDTSYPWPQIIHNPNPIFLDNNNFITNEQLDYAPFRPPQRYQNNTGEGDLIPYDIEDIVSNGSTPPAHSHFGCVDFSMFHSHIEGQSQSSFISGAVGENSSFKSSATHEFGIVYYDERGRHGYVNYLDSVYVEGYSEQSRGVASQGTAHIKLKLLHDPPSWAYNYKIAYSKNTSVSDFIQYSAGGAFVAEGESSGGDPSRIYVSLNYLQGHPISYSSAWGARSQEGSMVLYTPKDGDRLRVISHMLPPTSDGVPERIYPLNYDFEVSGVVSLDDSEQNPLAYIQGSPTSTNEGNVVVDENRQGLFLILKNNNNASGFRYEDVRASTDNWGNNAIVEIYSPSKELDPEDRLFYEIGDTYRVLTQPPIMGPPYRHEQSEIILTEGDVFFRSVAVNLREYNVSFEETGLVGYEDIIINTLADPNVGDDINEFRSSESNFKSYYLESPAGTNLFKSDAISIGRPNIIKHDGRESLRSASVVHSEKNITNSSKVSYSSFNRSIPINKDLDPNNGEINYLGNHRENCFFVQKDKCGYIPVDRNIISDVSGESSLIASSKFLNTPKYYAGRGGCDGNPESVVSIDSVAYFANKSLGEVYRVSGVNGVNIISENNMKSYFANLFKDVMMLSKYNGKDVRVVGGYDPVKNEYLLTVLNPGTFAKVGDIVEPEHIIQPDVFSPFIEVAQGNSGFGCMDPNANNYDENALYADNSCKYTYGCTNPTSDNYNPDAGVDDGSCLNGSPWPWNACEWNGMYEGTPIYQLVNLGSFQSWAVYSLETGYSDAAWYVALYNNALIYKNISTNQGTFDVDIYKAMVPRVGVRYAGSVDPSGEDPSGGPDPEGAFNTQGVYGTNLEFYIIPDDQVADPNELYGGFNGWIANGEDYNTAETDNMLTAMMLGTVIVEDPDFIGPWECQENYYYNPDYSLVKMAGLVRSLKNQTIPLAFTGNLCDYPMLQDKGGNITVFSINNAFQQVKAMVEDPENVFNDGAGGLIAATHLFPNFAGGAIEPSLEAFTELLPIPPAGPNLPDPPNFLAGFPSLNFEELGGNWFNGVDEWGALAVLNPEWYSVDKNGMPVGGPVPPFNESTINCNPIPDETLAYTGNLCDYPLLFNDSGVINIDSANAAFSDVSEMIIDGEITMAAATFVFPDLNNDGQIQIQDLLEMLIENPNIACEGAQPYTGNPCDYPALLDPEGNITGDSLTEAYNVINHLLQQGLATQEYATTVFPDLFSGGGSGDGSISVADFIAMLELIPVDCQGKPGKPGDGGGVPIKSNLKKPSIKEGIKRSSNISNNQPPPSIDPSFKGGLTNY
tara:strand:+ start:4957 stop:12435 length:7479 start_codon:yes stop_codon:yes gene_type:complete